MTDVLGVFDELGRFTGLGDEMRTIVLGSLRDYPAMQATTALTAASRQLIRVSTGEGVVTTLWHTYGIMERYTPWVVPAMRAARQQHGELQFHAINLIHVPIALFSMTMLPVLIAIAVRRRAVARYGLLGATILMALLINSFVCGALSNPHDRYGARLIWLAPLTVGLGLLSIGMRWRSIDFTPHLTWRHLKTAKVLAPNTRPRVSARVDTVNDD